MVNSSVGQTGRHGGSARITPSGSPDCLYHPLPAPQDGAAYGAGSFETGTDVPVEQQVGRVEAGWRFLDPAPIVPPAAPGRTCPSLPAGSMESFVGHSLPFANAACSGSVTRVSATQCPPIFLCFQTSNLKPALADHQRNRGDCLCSRVLHQGECCSHMFCCTAGMSQG